MKRQILQAIYFIDNCWKLVMDNRYNPLKYIPDPSIQGYFTLVLFTMWSFFFGLVATYYMGWYGYNGFISFVVHCSIIIPLLVTRAAFLDAEREGAKWLKDIQRRHK